MTTQYDWSRLLYTRLFEGILIHLIIRCNFHRIIFHMQNWPLKSSDLHREGEGRMLIASA